MLGIAIGLFNFIEDIQKIYLAHHDFSVIGNKNILS